MCRYTRTDTRYPLISVVPIGLFFFFETKILTDTVTNTKSTYMLQILILKNCLLIKGRCDRSCYLILYLLTAINHIISTAIYYIVIRLIILWEIIKINRITYCNNISFNSKCHKQKAELNK